MGCVPIPHHCPPWVYFWIQAVVGFVSADNYLAMAWPRTQMCVFLFHLRKWFFDYRFIYLCMSDTNHEHFPLKNAHLCCPILSPVYTPRYQSETAAISPQSALSLTFRPWCRSKPHLAHGELHGSWNKELSPLLLCLSRPRQDRNISHHKKGQCAFLRGHLCSVSSVITP